MGRTTCSGPLSVEPAGSLSNNQSDRPHSLCFLLPSDVFFVCILVIYIPILSLLYPFSLFPFLSSHFLFFLSFPFLFSHLSFSSFLFPLIPFLSSSPSFLISLISLYLLFFFFFNYLPLILSSTFFHPFIPLIFLPVVPFYFLPLFSFASSQLLSSFFILLLFFSLPSFAVLYLSQFPSLSFLSILSF